jgi:hypothetical protein
MHQRVQDGPPPYGPYGTPNAGPTPHDRGTPPTGSKGDEGEEGG